MTLSIFNAIFVASAGDPISTWTYYIPSTSLLIPRFAQKESFLSLLSSNFQVSERLCPYSLNSTLGTVEILALVSVCSGSTIFRGWWFPSNTISWKARAFKYNAIDVWYSTNNFWTLCVLTKVFKIDQTFQSLAVAKIYSFAISNLSAWYFPRWLLWIYSTAPTSSVCPADHWKVNETSFDNKRRRLKVVIPCPALWPIIEAA